MKTNIDHLFKSDKSCEKDGVDFDCGNGVVFTLARFGGHNEQVIAQKSAKKYKPYAFQVQKGTLSQEIEDRIRAEIFCEVCLKGWKGFKIDGQEVPYSQEKAIEILTAMPDLFNALYGFATNFDHYKADLGNS